MIRIKYRCPECSYEFNYDHHPSVDDDPCPRYCGKCGFDSEGEYDRAVVTPMIGKPRSKAIDAVYEDTTKGADHRAQLAQEHFGISQEEANSLKITDFKGGTVEGEPANIEVMNPVSDIMKSNASTFGFNQSGLGFSQSVSEGFSPNAGARAQRQVRQIHQQISSDPRMAGTLSSDIPALETRPETGYRRRV